MDQFHIHSASMQLAALTCLQKRLSKISKFKGDSSISFYFGRPSLVSGVVLVEGGERVGVFDAAIGDVGAVASGDGGGGGHGGADGRGRVGAASAVLAVGQRGAQVGLKKEELHLHKDVCPRGNGGNNPFKCIKLKCFWLFSNKWKLPEQLMD